MIKKRQYNNARTRSENICLVINKEKTKVMKILTSEGEKFGS